MRPSFPCAMAWPFSAAYSSEFTALTVSPALSQFAPERNASIGVIGGGPRLPSVLLPSSACAGAVAKRPPISIARNRLSTVRIALFLGRAAGVRHCAVDGGTNLLRVLPQVTGSVFALARLPLPLALSQFIRGKLDVERALHRIDLDDVTVADEPDRPPARSLGADVADAEPPRCAGEATVGDQRDLFAGALAIKGGGGRKHLAHTGTAARPLVADHQHVAVLVFAVLDRVETGFLAIEAARRAAEFKRFHAGDLHDCALRRQVALEPDHAASGQQWLVCRTHDVLIGIPFYVFQIFGDRASGYRQAIAVQITVI